MSTVTLDTCAQEPIHIPGAIQPHGVLFACRDQGLIVSQVSANLCVHLGIEPAAILGRPLAELLTPESADRLRAANSHAQLREINPLRVVAKTGLRFDAVLHRPPHSKDLLVVELEPLHASSQDSAPTFDPRLRGSVLRLQSARDVARLYAAAAAEVRALTGFDRVMVYRFDAQWNGEVVAESRRSDLEPFLGLHYPASDIPAQARHLYTVNWLRFICDISYVPAPLVPVLDPVTAVPLDLSYAVLRSVSPIHVEYLQNMGVTASMSVSLILEGKLVGLISCHHYSGAKVIPFTVRDTAEYLGQALSWQLGILEQSDQAERALQVNQIEAEFVRTLWNSDELIEGLSTPALLSLTASSGAAVVLQEGTRLLGKTPPEPLIRELVEWLRRTGQDVFATDCLSEQICLVARDRQGPRAGVESAAHRSRV